MQRLRHVRLVVAAALGVHGQVELDLMPSTELGADLLHRVDRGGGLHPDLVQAHDLVSLPRLPDRVDRLLGRALQLVQESHPDPFQIVLPNSVADQACPKIITTLRSSGSTLTVTCSPSANGLDG